MTATPELLRCPVCRGVGFHPHGFYTATETPNGSTAINISTEKCRSCNNGIIGLAPTPDTRLREAAEIPDEVIRAAETMIKTSGLPGQRLCAKWILWRAGKGGKG